jgi:hypothetical protein
MFAVLPNVSIQDKSIEDNSCNVKSLELRDDKWQREGQKRSFISVCQIKSGLSGNAKQGHTQDKQIFRYPLNNTCDTNLEYGLVQLNQQYGLSNEDYYFINSY